MMALTRLLSCYGLYIATVANAQWTKPNAKLPSFSDTFTVGERIFVSWLGLNDSTNDLWLTRFDTSTDSFATRLATAQDISKPSSFGWTIAINTTEITEDTRFLLQFLPVSTEYNASAELSLPSPPFNLILPNQAPNGTIGASSSRTAIATITSAESSVATTAARPGPNADEETDSNLTGLTVPAKVGIAVGAVGVTIVTILAGLLLAVKRRRQRRQSQEVEGPYEVLGDKKFAMELSSKESTIHELNSARENSISEAASSPVHEIATIIKRPGLHELPS